jgi:hypothetical protein
MGMEYKLRFLYPDEASVTLALRRLPMVREVRRANIDFEFRTPESKDPNSMPDASAHVEKDGLYFCVYGGLGEEFLGVVIARLVDKFGRVTVAELEE